MITPSRPHNGRASIDFAIAVKMVRIRGLEPRPSVTETETLTLTLYPDNTDWSGWLGSNQRPLRSRRSTLPLSYTLTNPCCWAGLIGTPGPQHLASQFQRPEKPDIAGHPRRWLAHWPVSDFNALLIQSGHSRTFPGHRPWEGLRLSIWGSAVREPGLRTTKNPPRVFRAAGGFGSYGPSGIELVSNTLGATAKRQRPAKREQRRQEWQSNEHVSISEFCFRGRDPSGSLGYQPPWQNKT